MCCEYGVYLFDRIGFNCAIVALWSSKTLFLDELLENKGIFSTSSCVNEKLSTVDIKCVVIIFHRNYPSVWLHDKHPQFIIVNKHLRSSALQVCFFYRHERWPYQFRGYGNSDTLKLPDTDGDNRKPRQQRTIPGMIELQSSVCIKLQRQFKFFEFVSRRRSIMRSYSLNDIQKDMSDDAYLLSDSWGMIFEISGPCLKYWRNCPAFPTV